MVEPKKNVDITPESLKELGEQIKGMFEGVKANIEDYRFTVTSQMEGLSVEFFIKAAFKKKNLKK